MLSRRSLLLGSGSLALTQILSGCSSPENGLKIIFLQGSIPLQLIKEFRSILERENQVVFKTKGKLQELFTILEKSADRTDLRQANISLLPWQQESKTVEIDLITLGDYWLKSAIQNNLIQPLELEKLTGWENLPTSCQKLVKRDRDGKLDENGSIWAAPYRWGTTVIIYREEEFKKLGWTPSDWSDLWREELQDRISLLNQPREVIGLTLKKLGYSFNTEDLTKIPDLKSELSKLQKQVKLYDSINYLQPLIVGDTWLAVGWSTDIIPLLKSMPNLKAIVPQSGTALFADLWVKSAFSQADKNSVIPRWIDFCWQLPQAKQISILTNASSPIVADRASEAIRSNSLLSANRELLDKSEFIYPLPESSAKQYQDFWQEMRK
ncbi:MAG: extracellular solute-binding protein [Prochloraceae cyanobacterium]